MMSESFGMEGNKQDGKRVVELWNAHKWTRAKIWPPKGSFCWLPKNPPDGGRNN